jgi:hypothetical protein
MGRGGDRGKANSQAKSQSADATRFANIRPIPHPKVARCLS